MEVKVMLRIPERLEWMTKEDDEYITWYWGCVCDYNMEWKDLADYEAWAKRILKK